MKTKLDEAQKEVEELREQLRQLREQTDESVHKVAEDRYVSKLELFFPLVCLCCNDVSRIWRPMHIYICIYRFD